MEKNKVDIRLQFKELTPCIFPSCTRNELVIRLQPCEAVYVKFLNKKPGLDFKTTIADLDLTYHERFPDDRIPQAYEALILDVINGNQSNFVRDDELYSAWNIFTPILHLIEKKTIKCENYPYGSRGPDSLNTFVEKFGYKRDEDYIWQSTAFQGKL